MAVCRYCGKTNRPGARFCRECAGALTDMWPLPGPQQAATAPLQPTITRPTPDDNRWLAATLTHGNSSSAMSPAASDQTTASVSGPQSDHQEASMEPFPPAEPTLFGGRYELLHEDKDGRVEAIDHQPWRRCWACGTSENQSGDAFCTNCGAALEKRSYLGSISPLEAPDALALLTTFEDEYAHTVLPTLSEAVEDDGRKLVLLARSRHTPLELPLDELTALRIGAGLARLQSVLHEQALLLGRIDTADLAMTSTAEPRLLSVPFLQRLPPEDDRAAAIQADLKRLAGLLEALTATPRTTQRLNEDEPPPTESLPDHSTLAEVLRQIRTGSISEAAALQTRLEDIIRERVRPQPLRQVVGAMSDTGMVRDHNEDSLLTLHLALNNSSTDYTRGLYAVADGMGGHAAGEVASGLAVRCAAELILKEYMALILDPDAEYDEQKIQEILHRAVLHANEGIRQVAQTQGNDMGTTITLALVFGDRAVVANVGDSRTYLYRDGRLRRISRDHSLVMRLVELGQLSDDDIYTHPQRNAVLRSLGDQSDVEVDLFTERLQPGDALLLCSDGQWEMTHDPEMEAILASSDDVQATCEALLNAANQAGGEDNVTSILVRLEAM